jgi:amino acid transporter
LIPEIGKQVLNGAYLLMFAIRRSSSTQSMQDKKQVSQMVTGAGPPDVLARHGYKQELKREMGWFSSFAMSFSIIAVTTGLFATYGAGLQTAGPAFIWTWPVVGVGQLLLALVFAKLARRIPLSGLAYQWTRELGGEALGWWAGWLMIIQVLTGLAAVCYAMASYTLPEFGIALTDTNVIVATTIVLFSIALINHMGVRIASVVNNVMVMTQIIVIVVVGVLLLISSVEHKTNSFHFLFSHPGHPGGLAFVGPLAFSSLMAAWTITGFESAANLAEETEFPEARVPFAIVSSEVFSVIIGFLILLGFTLAIPSLEVAVASPVPFAYIMAHHFSFAFTNIVMGIILLEIYACSLANLTILGRVLWAMARDRQLPASSWFGALNSHKVPANAMWLSAIVAVAFTWWARHQAVIAGVSGLAAYATYQMVVGCALLYRHESSEPIAEGRKAIVPKALGISALAWLLVCMGALALPRSAWSNDKAILVGLIFGLCVRISTRGKRRGLEKRTRMGEVTS